MPGGQQTGAAEITLVREVAEFEAREEAEAMAEDEHARAMRHLRAEQVEKRVEILTAERDAVKKELEELRKTVARRRTAIAKKLDRNTFWTKVGVVLVLIALVGPTDKVALFVTWFLEMMTKVRTK